MEVLTQHLDKRRAYALAPEGMTCAQLVDTFAPPIEREFVAVLVNGQRVPQEYWERVTPREHTTVIVAITPGKGGKANILLMIASIAIAIVAPYAAVAMLGTSVAGTVGALTLTGTIASAAIGIVANMALAAIFKPSQPSISAANASTNSQAASPTYSVQGQSNLMDPYGPVRRIFGMHRIYPVVVGKPYVEVWGDDQYLTVLYDIGAGDYEVSDVRIGASHIGYFSGAMYYVHRNTRSVNYQWYWGVRHDEPFALKLSESWVHLDTTEDAGWFVVNFVFASGIAKTSEQTGAIGQNTVQFQLEYSDYGAGNWRPIDAAYSWWSSRTINEPASAPTEVTGGAVLRSDTVGGGYPSSDDPEGSWGGSPPDRTDGGDLVRVPRVVRPRTITTTFGYPAGTTAMTLRSTTLAMGAGSRFIYNGVSYTVQGGVGTSAGSVSFTPPLQTELITQKTIETTGEDGGTSELYWTSPTVDLFVTGGVFEVRDQRVQQLALSVTVRPTADMAATRRYSIRARQTLGFGDERYTQGDMVLVSLSTISGTVSPVNLRTEHTLLEFRIKANDQISGTVDDLSCYAESYLWSSRGGVWTYALNRNPAWALWEVLTGKMNKRPIPASRLSLPSFEAWAAYCDEPHPATGLARARLDLVVDFNTTLFALAQTITAAGRATLIPGDGLLRVIIDRPQSVPVQVFTPHNSKGFQGTRTFIEAPHAFRTKFMSRDTWRIEEYTVYNDGYDASNATVFEQLEFPGVTRNAQVWCDARYRMAQGIHRQETWTLDVDVENLVCTRGDMVHVAHDVPRLGGLPARIKEVFGGGASWELTEPVDFGGNPSAFGYTIRSLNGVIHQGQFAAQLSPYHVAPAVAVPGVMVGDLHVWGEMTKVTYPFLVAAINPQPDLAATLTLVPYAGAAIFNADTGAIPPYDPVVDHDLGSIAPPPIAHVTILQKIVYVNRRPLLSVSFDWRDYHAPTFVSYEVWVGWVLHEGGVRFLLGRSSAPNMEWLQGIDLSANRSYPGSHFCVWVVGVNAFGAKRSLAETPATCDDLLGDFTPPAPPPYLDLDLKRDTITLIWDHPNEPDIDYYEVRYTPLFEGATYFQSTIVAPQIPYPTRSMDIPARLGTYFLKCVDTSGNRSDGYAAAFTPGENIWNLNVVARIDDQPEAWPGIKSAFQVVGSRIETVQTSPGIFARRAEYYYDEIFDGGAIFQTRFTSKIAPEGFNASSMMATWIPLAIADPIAGFVILDNGERSAIAEVMDVWHEVRWVLVENVMADWVPLASADPIGVGESSFGGWRRFLVGDYIGQYFQFRLIAEYIGPDIEADVGASIAGAQIEIDMTDRIDGV
jgi:sulfur carrier protein ThiS